MADLKKPGSTDLTNKRTFGVKPGSFQDRVANATVSDIPNPTEGADGSHLPNRIALLLDHSSSMGGDKIKQLRIAVQSFVDNCDFDTTAIAVETFPLGEVRVVLTPTKSVLDAAIPTLAAIGSTPMGETMEYALENTPLTRAVMVSDGAPDSMDHAYKQAAQYKLAEVIIDTVHIGTEESGEEVMRRIAEITGGMFIKFKDAATFAKSFKYLSPKFRAMLNAPGVAQAMLGADEIGGQK